MEIPALELRGITKRFGAVIANEDISLSVDRGEVLALLGENGAGKSTLVSVLFGHHAADAGDIRVNGRSLARGNPRAALAAGIGMVHQHFTLADNLSVLDNVIIGTESLLRPVSSRRRASRRLLETATRLGFAINPDAPIASLSVGERQRVEIIKALYRGAKILILDEPTSVLTPQEAALLFTTLRNLAGGGVAVIFISHKLNEVLSLSDRVAVLRNGRLVAARRTADLTAPELAELMIGTRLASRAQGVGAAKPGCDAKPRLSVSRLAAGAKLREASFDVASGEIFGIAGVAGNGQADLAEAIFGLRSPSAGQIAVDGRAVAASPRAFLAAGVARIPQDRQAIGVIGDLSVWENAVSEQRRAKFSRNGFLRLTAARRFARGIVAAFNIRCRDVRMPTRQLSGGNIQKLVLGRALVEKPGVIVAMQPTWGLDVGAVAYVHGELLAARERGAAILLISEDLEELFGIADRVAVMAAGYLSAARRDWTVQQIGLAMAARV